MLFFYLTNHIKYIQFHEYIGHKYISEWDGCWEPAAALFGQIDMPIYYYTLQQAFILELIDEILASIHGPQVPRVKISFPFGNIHAEVWSIGARNDETMVRIGFQRNIFPFRLK